MTDTGPAPKPGILDIAPYVGGKSAIAGVAEPMKLSSNENALGAGQKAREAYSEAIKTIHIYPDGRATKLRAAVAEAEAVDDDEGRRPLRGHRAFAPATDATISASCAARSEAPPTRRPSSRPPSPAGAHQLPAFAASTLPP